MVGAGARRNLSRWYHVAREFRAGMAAERGYHSVNPPTAPPLPPGTLERYFDENTTGPGLWKWRHYFPIYERYFSRFVGQEVHVLEIGVHSGGSLRMWSEYFGDRAMLYGVDLRPEIKVYENERTRCFVGDQSDPELWKHVLREVPAIDIVIDDGAHMALHQIVTLEALLPHLRPGGVYLCEDVIGEFHAFHSYVDGFARGLQTRGPFEHGDPAQGRRPSAFQQDVAAVHRHPYITVIEKQGEILDRMISEKHGTEWQPFGHQHLV